MPAELDLEDWIDGATDAIVWSEWSHGDVKALWHFALPAPGNYLTLVMRILEAGKCNVQHWEVVGVERLKGMVDRSGGAITGINQTRLLAWQV